jgi:hypothetical protein
MVEAFLIVACWLFLWAMLGKIYCRRHTLDGFGALIVKAHLLAACMVGCAAVTMLLISPNAFEVTSIGQRTFRPIGALVGMWMMLAFTFGLWITVRKPMT